MPCSDAVNAVFGPWAGPFCRGGLDFTLPFEMVFFTIIPDGVFILAAFWQMRPWKKHVVIANPGTVRSAKLIVIAIVEALSIAHLALIARYRSDQVLLIVAASVDAVAFLVVGLLSRHLHARSPRPSLTITLYLCMIILLNLATARTLWLMKNVSTIAIVYTIGIAFKAVCLAFENIEKRHILTHPSDYSPEELAGPLSRTFFLWLLSLFRAGYAFILTIPQLLPLSADMKNAQLSKKLDGLTRQARKQSLFSQLVTHFSRACLLPVIPRISLLGFTLAQPFLIYTSVNYINTPRSERSEEAGQLLIFAYLLTFIGYSLSNALYWHLVNRLMIKVRGSLVSLIYRSTFQRGSPLSDDTASLTLMTVDVEKAMISFEDIHELWANVIHIAIAVYVLAVQMSWASVAPVVVCVACFAATVPIAGRVGVAQKMWNRAVQERISLAATVIRHLREVHMLGLGSGTSSVLRKMRLQEISKSHIYRRLMAFILGLSQGTTALGPFATFALYAAVSQVSGDKVLPAKSFASLSLISMIASPFSTLVQALPSFVAGISSLSRIEEYVSANVPVSDLLSEASTTAMNNKATDSKTASEQSVKPWAAEEKKSIAVSVQGGQFGWQCDKTILENVNFAIPTGSVTAVIGPVGAGKSTLLYGILKQSPVFSGDVSASTSYIAFCPQQPWLTSGTVRLNIIGNQLYDAAWYQEVISSCSLAPDLEEFEDGDMKNVGNEGSNLSGGQRQRVALARAVYSRHQLVLLDDSLSGLDRASTRSILSSLFGQNGLLRRHDITTIICSSTTGVLEYADHVLAVDNKTATLNDGTMASAGDQIAIAASNINPEASEAADTTKINNQAVISNDENTSLMLEEGANDLRRKTGDFSIYWFYIKAAGPFHACIFVGSALLCAVFIQVSILWVQWWSDDSTTGAPKSIGYYLGVYAVLSVGALVGLVVASWTLIVNMVSRSGRVLHQTVLDTLFNAPASYFATVDQGVTLNRFNQDMQLIDYNLPLAVVNTTLYACICLVQVIIVSIAAKYMAITIPFCLFIIYLVQGYYLKTSRQLRLLDIEAKAPLFTNFQDMIRGLSSIRAYGGNFGSFLEEEHSRLLDCSQQPIYLLYTVQRWLALVLDLIVSGLTLLLIIMAVKLDSGISGSDLGVALVTLTTFNSYLTFLIRFWASMETSLGAISRVRRFSEETPAAQGGIECLDFKPTDTAHIVFHQVTATYGPTISDTVLPGTFNQGDSNDLPRMALSGINLTIPQGTRLAITGRSGSGKSSLCSTLLRLLPIQSGKITIGDIDVSTVDQDLVQRRLNTISQTPFFLSELSLQDNLDPPGCGGNAESIDETNPWKIKAMEDVFTSLGLWDLVQQRGGLSTKFDPSSWSIGQLQLLSLTRAIVKARWLRENPGSGWKILVLDEATSSVDEDTATLMRKHINQEFVGYTILAIMHRMEGVVEDMDEMIVLSQGKIARQGRPADLLSDENVLHAVPQD